ncbi:MAG: metallophosphoesterase [Promethearchaeota archaeon]|jgi:hypothetical protein
MHLKYLAISDTHLGEDTSFLSFPRGRQILREELCKAFGNGAQFQIDELILLGDIPDTSLSSISQVITQTNAFIQTIESAANISKVVYIPGNHDHTLWTDYVKLRYGTDIEYRVTDHEGELIVDQNQVIDHQACKDLSTVFFGYPYGQPWETLQSRTPFDFLVANPIYAVKENNRTYVFTHGTHFKGVVTSPEWMKKLIDYTQLDQLIAKIEIKSDCDVSEAESLEDLERIVAPFVDSLWISARNDPTTRSDQLWYLYSVLSSRFDEDREIPDATDCYPFSDYLNVEEGIIKRLNPGDKFMTLLKDHFLDHLLDYLDEKHLLSDKITFVYGDIHDGGWGKIPERRNGRDINLDIFNCGGWVVHDKENHPPCHIFAVDNNGKEYILDISFKGVEMLGNPLIEIAAMDYENRRQGINIIIRYLLERFG